jgi:hypothetical protein
MLIQVKKNSESAHTGLGVLCGNEMRFNAAFGAPFVGSFRVASSQIAQAFRLIEKMAPSIPLASELKVYAFPSDGILGLAHMQMPVDSWELAFGLQMSTSIVLQSAAGMAREAWRTIN